MHNAVHLSGGGSSRPTLKPHQSADSISPKRASWMGHSNLQSSPAASSHQPAAGEGKPAFENNVYYLNPRFPPGPRAQFPSDRSTIWLTCVHPRLDRRHDHLLVRSWMTSG